MATVDAEETEDVAATEREGRFIQPVCHHDEIMTRSTSASEYRPAELLRTDILWDKLNAFQDGLARTIEEQSDFQTLVVGTTAMVSTGLTVGYAIWLIRGGSLLASMVSVMPAWRFLDPLPILESFLDDSDSDGQEENEDTIESFITRNRTV